MHYCHVDHVHYCACVNEEVTFKGQKLKRGVSLLVTRFDHFYLMEEGRKEPSALKNFLAGGVGGSCVVLSGHPLDTIKVKKRACFWFPFSSGKGIPEINYWWLCHY